MKNRSKLLALVTLAAFLSLEPALNAQAFKNGTTVGNIGAGFGWYSYGYGVTSLPAISLSLEKGIKDIENVGPISIGGIIGFKHASYAWTSAYDWSWNDMIIAARGALHYDLFKNPKVDTYGGVAVGVRIESWSYYTILDEKVHENKGYPLFALYLGGRYYFTDKFGAFGELGYGLGYLTLGLSYKLK
jgi:hypothetical protein